ncbi:MAG: penicillin acylase family protein [Bryobacteraceae bacterium]
MSKRCLWVLLLAFPGAAQSVDGLTSPVEVLRDKWGVPHIYAQNTNDLFFAQGWVTAKDRLFQIDLWRRIGTGKLAEVLGAKAIPRDRIARLVRFRGDWTKEWESYSPDTKQIATAFTSGINAYIRSLAGNWPVEFKAAGYAPGMWEPEDVTARVAGLLMIRNFTREVQRAEDIRRFGLDIVQRYMPPDPPVKIEIPRGLDLDGIGPELLADYNATVGPVRLQDQGSNNWVVAGSRTSTGKPLLANDPHRPVNIPSLRKTVHLVAPGWNVIGAGEPALPGVALGHNEDIGFGFTIVGIDQGDLYVEKLNPVNPDEYEYKGQWQKMKIVEEPLVVKGEAKPRRLLLRYTIHGPVLAEDLGRHRAYSLKWVGSEPGTAGYLAALRLLRARNWNEFEAAVAHYKVPSENLVYADRAGNIGWIASGMTPVRPNWSGLLPVPGDAGEYEWSGYLDPAKNPRAFNPQFGAIWTANHNILPKDYPYALGYEWAAPFRAFRLEEILRAQYQFDIPAMQRMQQDVLSHPARILRSLILNWQRKKGDLPEREERVLAMFERWDFGTADFGNRPNCCRLRADSVEATIFEIWSAMLPDFFYGPGLGSRVNLFQTLGDFHRNPDETAFRRSLSAALDYLEIALGKDMSQWQWGRLHTITFRHPVDRKAFHRGPIARPGDANTVNSTSGGNLRQTNGASYRQILDTADWDRSVMTNVPGESGDPSSPFYDSLLEEWASGGYHPMPYSRKAVEASTSERMRLEPAPVSVR